MKGKGSRRVLFALACVVVLAGLTAAHAFQVRQEKSRFDALVIYDPVTSLGAAALPVASLPDGDALRSGWDAFRAAHGGAWAVYLDRRSGAPLLVEGRGMPWIAGPGNSLQDAAPVTLAALETSLRRFASENRALLLADDGELVLDRSASGRLTPEVWQVVFDHAVGGIPVSGDHYIFTIGRGNLVSFGASRWTRVGAAPAPTLDVHRALTLLREYMGLADGEKVDIVDAGSLAFVPLAAAGSLSAEGPYGGPVGSGYTSALVWRFAVRVVGEPGTWVGQVDAHTGVIRAFFDDDRYAQVKGGVYPITDDQLCPDGCEQPNYPMPYADMSIGGTPSTTSGMGLFECSPAGSTATTTLAGPYFRISDTCGAVSQSVTCDNDLDLGVGPGTDCAVPAGASAGDTHAARTGFHHLNRAAEHARYWLPSNTWLTQQVTENVNINATCNASWNGAINVYKSGGGCNNTGEVVGVVLHEWGHGMDANDGGGYDNPSEAYADITELINDHTSCIGRGFDQSAQCSGYGNACLNCTGIRDQDWDQRANHTPSTPSGFIQNNCGGGSGPCGKETHCEGYLAAETIWDLAARDLPAAGMDPDSAWQLMDRLWYQSRNGSSGNAYNCALPNSDGCGATSWFSKLRNVDDDDGNLANGTPHAAAIFAAFNRHNIACGTADDAANKNTTVCPTLAAPVLSGAAGSSTVNLSWTAVPNAASYRILRNDIRCAYSSTVIASVPAPATSHADTGLANGFTEYYRVQAVGSNSVCESPVSNCQSVTPQPFVGSIRLDRPAYNCSALITIIVTDGNIGASTTTATIWSTTETTPQTITLTQVSPGSAKYTGSIQATADPPASDGLLSLSNGDVITARYIDADDGQGAHNVAHDITGSADCVAPVIAAVQSNDISGSSARITWTTGETATSVVHFGPAIPPGSTASDAALVTSHSVTLNNLSECTPYFYSVESADAVGNVAADNAGGAYYTFSTGKNNQPSYTSTDTPVSIPDNNPTGATSTISVPVDVTVLDVNVTVNITHTYDGDITLYLITPTGTSITLSDRHGGSSDNYTNTVFDDEAATPIASGSAPFTGSFRPDTPLSAADGISSLGAWKLKVVDSANSDVGTINNWTLTLTFPAAACGPHALYEAHALVQDVCTTGGGGNANGYWDPGEQAQFKVSIKNDGTMPLTGLTATVVPLTPGVTMIDATANYADLARGASADSLAPHFTAQLPAGLDCGSTLSFRLNIVANEGSWSNDFAQVVGQATSGAGTALNETFGGGIPASWTVVDGGAGGGAAATWTTANPGGRAIAAPMAAPVAIVDSDYAGSGANQDEQLITPALNLSTALTAALEFDQYFNWYDGGTDEIGEVDVRSSKTGGVWVNVLRQRGASSPNPDHRLIDVTAQAAGAGDFRVRFHYFQATYEWYWQVDNVTVNYVGPPGCVATVCNAAPSAPRPTPDGTFGSAMTCSRSDAAGGTIQVHWDVATCASPGYHILYGALANVASYAIDGGVCSLGTSGNHTWTGAPAGGIWFIVVSDDTLGVEGSWGTNSAGAQRGGATSSGQCGSTARDNSPTCP